MGQHVVAPAVSHISESSGHRVCAFRNKSSQEIGDVGHPAMGAGIEPKAYYPTLQLVAERV
jgi:hypothetical protein